MRVATQFAITGSTCSRLVRALAKQSAGTRVRSSPEMSSRLSLNLSCDMVIWDYGYQDGDDINDYVAKDDLSPVLPR